MERFAAFPARRLLLALDRPLALHELERVLHVLGVLADRTRVALSGRLGRLPSLFLVIRRRGLLPGGSLLDVGSHIVDLLITIEQGGALRQLREGFLLLELLASFHLFPGQLFGVVVVVGHVTRLRREGRLLANLALLGRGGVEVPRASDDMTILAPEVLLDIDAVNHVGVGGLVGLISHSLCWFEIYVVSSGLVAFLGRRAQDFLLLSVIGLIYTQSKVSKLIWR